MFLVWVTIIVVKQLRGLKVRNKYWNIYIYMHARVLHIAGKQSMYYKNDRFLYKKWIFILSLAFLHVLLLCVFSRYFLVKHLKFEIELFFINCACVMHTEYMLKNYIWSIVPLDLTNFKLCFVKNWQRIQ